MAPGASSGAAQKDRQAGQCGMECVPGILMVAATEFAGLRVVEGDTTTACHARKHGEKSSTGLWTLRIRAHIGLPWGL